MTIEELNNLNKEILEGEKILREKKALKTNAIRELDAEHCWKCATYFDKGKCDYSTYTETSTESIFSDGGYGDDEIGEVTRRYVQRKCPLCGAVVEETGYIVKTENRRRRT